MRYITRRGWTKKGKSGSRECSEAQKGGWGIRRFVTLFFPRFVPQGTSFLSARLDFVTSKLISTTMLQHGQPSPFLSLPNEMLGGIIQHLCPHCSQKGDSSRLWLVHQQLDQPLRQHSSERRALASLSLVSSRLRDIAQLHLYHEFPLDHHHPEPHKRFTGFMRTVAQRRDLAAYVERAFIHEDLLSELWIPDIVEIFNDLVACLPSWPFGKLAPIDVVEQQVKSPEIVEEDMSEALKRYICECFIYLLPNLKHLSAHDRLILLNGSLVVDDEEYPPPGSYHMPIVKTLHLVQWYGYSDRSVRFIDSMDSDFLVHLLSNIETLSIDESDLFQELDREYDAPEGFPPMPRLKHLRITRTNLVASQLEQHLRGHDNLQTFYYDVAGVEDFDLDSAPGEIVALLQRHCKSVKSLHLGFGGLRPARILGVVDSLDGFNELTTLFLDIGSIYDESNIQSSRNLITGFLPRTLEYFDLGGKEDERIADRCIRDLLGLAEEISEGRYPRLQRVRYDADLNIAEKGLEELFSGSGTGLGRCTSRDSD